MQIVLTLANDTITLTMSDKADTIKNSDVPTLNKTLGVYDGIAILVGICIGAGIYSNPQIIAGHLSSFSAIMLLWGAGGIFVFISSLIYAELGTRMPYTGGEYAYITRCFGPFAGFIFGWGQLLIVRTSATAGLALITAEYLGYFIPLEQYSMKISQLWIAPYLGAVVTLENSAFIFTAMIIVSIFGALNYIGIQRASFFQKISTALKISGILLIVFAGLFFSKSQENLLSTQADPVNNMGLLGNIVSAMFMIIFAHTGWERLGYSAGEIKNPRRVLPISLLLGTSIVILLYALTNYTYHSTLGMEGMRTSTLVASDTMMVLMGPVGATLITLLVIVSATGSMNGTLMTAPRVYFAMARDGIFFKWLDYIHPRFRSPSRSILVHCLWAIVILLLRGNFGDIARGLVFTLLIFYALSNLALFQMRKDDIGGEDVFEVPLYPYLPLVSLFFIVALLVVRAIFEFKQSLIDLTFIITGIPFAIYWCYFKGKVGTPHSAK